MEGGTNGERVEMRIGEEIERVEREEQEEQNIAREEKWLQQLTAHESWVKNEPMMKEQEKK
jgi:hypothetical protein